MAIACRITPRVKDDKGELHASRLHQDIGVFTDSERRDVLWDMSRALAKERRREAVPPVTLKSGERVNIEVSPEVAGLMKDGHEFSEVRFDKNGEPVVEDLLGLTKAGDVVSDEELTKGLGEIYSDRRESIESDMPSKDGRKSEARVLDDVRKAVKVRDAAAEFNKESPLRDRVYATAEHNPVERSVGMTFHPVKESPDGGGARAHISKEVTDKGAALHERMTGWLERSGIGVDALLSAEERSGVDGVTDYSATRRTVSGLAAIVRVAHGRRGDEAITEEAAHVAIAALVGKDNNVRRAVDSLKNNESLMRRILGDEAYERYGKLYGGDKGRLAHEAAGHLLRDALVSEDAVDKSGVGKFKSLWRRVVDAVKGFFGRFNESELDAMLRSDKAVMHKTARDILDGSFFTTPDFSEEIKAIGQLFALTEKHHKKLKDFVESLFADTRTRKLRIPAGQNGFSFNKQMYEDLQLQLRMMKHAMRPSEDLSQDPDYDWDGKGERFEVDNSVDDPSDHMAYSRLLATIEVYMRLSVNNLKTQLFLFEHDFEAAESIEEKASILFNIDSELKSFRMILDAVIPLLDEVKENSDMCNEQGLVDSIYKSINGYDGVKSLSDLINDLSHKINKRKVPLFIEYVSKFIPLENIIVPAGGKAYGKKSGDRIDLEEQMKESNAMGGIDHWLLGASLSNVFPVQVFQRMLNIFQLKVRDEWLDYQKRLQELTLELEQAGYHDQEWMFERKDGKLTGRYIKPDSAEYKSLSQAQRRFYDEVIAIKTELDNMLPPQLRDVLNSVKIRKNLMERLEGDDKVGDILKTEFKEMYSITSDDEYLLQQDKALVDFDGNAVNVLPVRFLRFAKEEDSQNMSMDIANTLTRYAQMCCNYSIMGRLMPVLEVGRSIMEQGSDVTTRYERDKDGNRVEVKSLKKRQTSNSSTLDRVNDILESELYGHRALDASYELGGVTISLSKIGQKLMALTAWSQYMLSPAAAIQNDITAQLQALISTSDKKYFDRSDLAWAHGKFTANLGDMFSEVGARKHNTKINLFNEAFNVMQKDEFNPFNHRRLKRMRVDDLYFMTTMGEYHANTIIALAIAHRTILKTRGGEKINLWDALEVVDMYEKKQRELDQLRKDGKVEEAEALAEQLRMHPEWKGSKSKYLVLKEGVTKEDGTAFTFKDSGRTTDKDVFIRKAMNCSHLLNGIYNREDAAKWQRYIGTQMIGMYRKWIAPSWYKRINGLNYSLDQQEWSEGYYHTLFRFGAMRFRALFDKSVAAELKGSKLTDMERRNLHLAVREMGVWVCVLALKLLLGAHKKENRNSFAYNQLYYFSARTLSELSSMTPTGMFTESQRIMQSPSAALTTVNNLLGCFSATADMVTDMVFDIDDTIKNGKYKGYSKFERAMIKSPLIPGVRPILGFLHPEDAVRFYE